MTPRRIWAEMTSEEVAALDAARVIAVLPVAAIEQHGPHLPLAVDAVLNAAVLERALARLAHDAPVSVLPAMTVGKSNEHIAFPGTLTLSFDTLARLWLEIGDSLARAGVRKLVLFNSHGGQIQVMDIVARELRVRHAMLVVQASWFRFGLPEGVFDTSEARHGIHGGDIETSMMLAVRPDLVRMDRAADFTPATEEIAQRTTWLNATGPTPFGWQAQDLHPAGVAGNAAIASAAKGEAAIAHAAAGLAMLLEEVDALTPETLRPGPLG